MIILLLSLFLMCSYRYICVYRVIRLFVRFGFGRSLCVDVLDSLSLSRSSFTVFLVRRTKKKTSSKHRKMFVCQLAFSFERRTACVVCVSVGVYECVCACERVLSDFWRFILFVYRVILVSFWSAGRSAALYFVLM